MSGIPSRSAKGAGRNKIRQASRTRPTRQENLLIPSSLLFWPLSSGLQVGMPRHDSPPVRLALKHIVADNGCLDSSPSLAELGGNGSPRFAQRAAVDRH